jgi:hypothetical protein
LDVQFGRPENPVDFHRSSRKKFTSETPVDFHRSKL